MRNSSLEACGDRREIAERFVEDGDEIGRGIVYGGEGDGAVGGPGRTDFVGQEGEFGGVFEELLKEGVSFCFFFFLVSGLGCRERGEDFIILLTKYVAPESNVAVVSEPAVKIKFAFESSRSLDNVVPFSPLCDVMYVMKSGRSVSLAKRFDT